MRELPNSTSMWFLILFQVFLNLKSVDEILRCNRLNDSYKVVLTFETACNPKLLPFNES